MENETVTNETSVQPAPKSRKKLFIGIAAAVLAVILAAVILIPVQQKASSYREACALLEQGSYEEAESAFSALGSYRDSETMVLECGYRRAAALMESGDFSSAAAVFGTLGDYSDAAAEKEACLTGKREQQLSAVKALMDAGRYDDAVSALAAIGSDSEINALIKECDYQKALLSVQSMDVDDAIAELETWDGYGDSAEQIAALKNTPAWLCRAYLDYEVGDTFTFGTYEQDNDTSDGAEPIEWLVLQKDENHIMLISVYTLDCRPFQTEFEDSTWETCELRAWLNDEFYNTAFTETEQSLIEYAYIKNPANAFHDVSSGNDTYDHVFLLSYNEADTLFAGSAARRAQPTAYARVMTTGYLVGEDNPGYSCWWLRTSGWDQRYAVYVHKDGHCVTYDSCQCYAMCCAIRPAIYIQLSY